MTRRRRLAVYLAFLAVFAAGTHSLAAQVESRGASQRGGDPLAEIRAKLPADPEQARIALAEALWEAVREVGAAELRLAQSLESSDSIQPEAQREIADRTVEARELLTALMDTIVFETDWGRAELDRLRRRFPTSSFFMRYEAESRKREGDLEGALALVDRLLGMRPSVAELQRERGLLLEELGRAEEAIVAYTLALELAPGDEGSFRALVRLRQANGTLDALLEQIERLRAIHPEMQELVEREREVQHRLGRVTGGAAAELKAPGGEDGATASEAMQ